VPIFTEPKNVQLHYMQIPYIKFNQSWTINVEITGRN